MKPCYWGFAPGYPDHPDDDCTGVYASKAEIDLFAASLVGGPIAPPPEVVRFAFHRAGLRSIKNLDYLSNADRALLVSDRLAAALLKLARTDVQPLRAVIQCKDGVTTDFQVMHLLHMRPCIDKSRSVAEMVRGLDFPVNYNKLVLRDNCMGSAKLARDAEYSSLVLVDRTIVEPLRAFTFNGFAIKEDSEYKGA